MKDYKCQMTNGHVSSALRAARVRHKLSQLELAQRAGTTQRHLSFVESGRSVPGRALLIRLTESLGLTLRERNDVLSAFGYAPAYPESDLLGPPLLPVLAALQHILDGHQPFPAAVVNRRGELVISNPAVGILTDDVAPELLTPPVNAYRLALHPRGLGPRVRNLGQWGRHITEGIRLDSLRNPDPVLDALRSELLGYLPAEPPGQDTDNLGFAVPLQLSSVHGELRLISTITTFATAADVTLAELRLEAFLPADEATTAILTDLNSRRRPRADAPR